MVAAPPSPAWSDCDSLDGIDDLDAFLESKGQLSHFPTPPLFASLKDETIVEEMELEVSDDEGELDSYRIAELFTQHATIGVEFNDLDVRMIERMLIQAELPMEVLALAFNILAGLDCHSLPPRLVPFRSERPGCRDSLEPGSIIYKRLSTNSEALVQACLRWSLDGQPDRQNDVASICRIGMEITSIQCPQRNPKGDGRAHQSCAIQRDCDPTSAATQSVRLFKVRGT